MDVRSFQMLAKVYQRRGNPIKGMPVQRRPNHKTVNPKWKNETICNDSGEYANEKTSGPDLRARSEQSNDGQRISSIGEERTKVRLKRTVLYLELNRIEERARREEEERHIG